MTESDRARELATERLWEMRHGGEASNSDMTLELLGDAMPSLEHARDRLQAAVEERAAAVEANDTAAIRLAQLEFFGATGQLLGIADALLALWQSRK